MPSSEWVYGKARCLACGYRWVAVLPADTDRKTLECSACGEQHSTCRLLRAP